MLIRSVDTPRLQAVRSSRPAPEACEAPGQHRQPDHRRLSGRHELAAGDGSRDEPEHRVTPGRCDIIWGSRKRTACLAARCVLARSDAVITSQQGQACDWASRKPRSACRRPRRLASWASGPESAGNIASVLPCLPGRSSVSSHRGQDVRWSKTSKSTGEFRAGSVLAGLGRVALDLCNTR